MKALTALGAAVLAFCSVPLVLTAPAQAAAGGVTLTVADVSPNTPAISPTPSPVVFTLTLDNSTDQTVSNIVINATRADPIDSQGALDAALKTVGPPSNDLRSDLKTALTVDQVDAGQSKTVTFRTTIATSGGAADICQCRNLIYPVYFTASVTTGDTRAELAHAQTYLPSFTKQPARTKVAWLWPLLDRPHRVQRDDLFTDDDLAGEVGLNGRLDKMLDVLENVSDSVPMTVLVDPDLIDSLAVMSTGYRVATPSGNVRGQYGALAASWLTRLRTVLTEHPGIDLQFTAFADPAVESLARNGLSWSVPATAAAQARIATALGTSAATTTAGAPTGLTWPADERVSAPTLAELARAGTGTIVMSDAGLTNGDERSAAGRSVDGDSGPEFRVAPDALAALPTEAGTVTAAITSGPIQALVRQILTRPLDTGLALLPQLVAQLAIRVDTSFDISHLVVIAPPRNVQLESPEVAERTILATAHTIWSAPTTLSSAVTSTAPVDHGRLRPYADGLELPAATVQAIRDLEGDLPVVTHMFTNPVDAASRLDAIPLAVQRAESTELLSSPALSRQYSAGLRHYVTRIRDGVQLTEPLRPYTLTSANSDLPVTMTNTLTSPVKVRIEIDPLSPEPAFHSPGTQTKTLAPGQRVQLKVPVHPGRVGTINLSVTIRTADGAQVGNAVTIKIRSTALGKIGIVITVVAAVVLALAVVLRLARRGMRMRRERAGDSPAATGAS